MQIKQIIIKVRIIIRTKDVQRETERDKKKKGMTSRTRTSQLTKVGLQKLLVSKVVSTKFWYIDFSLTLN
jgi:hypothetical protein